MSVKGLYGGHVKARLEDPYGEFTWSIVGEPLPLAPATRNAPPAHHVTLSTRTQSAGNWRFYLPGSRVSFVDFFLY